MILAVFQYKSKQGLLHHNTKTDEWTFLPGLKGTLTPVPLPNFKQLAYSMLDNKKLFQGWKSSRVALSVRQVRASSNVMAHLIIARKVSARNLKLVKAPTSLTQHKLLDQGHIISRRI